MRLPTLLLAVLAISPLLPAVACAGGTANSLHPEFVVQTGHESIIVDAAFSPNGKLIASIDASGTLVFWDVDGNRVLRHIVAHEEAGSLSFSEDGRMLATCGKGLVHIWRVSTGEHIRTLPSGEYASKRSGAVAFLPGSTRLAVANDQDRFAIHDVHTGKSLREIPGVFAVSHPNQPLSAMMLDSTIVLHDLQFGQKLHTLSFNSSQNIRSLAISPDGMFFTATDFNDTVYVWHVPTQKLIRKENIKHSSFVLFLDTSTLLVSASMQIQSIPLPEGPITGWGEYTHGDPLLRSKHRLAIARGKALALFDARNAAPQRVLEARSESGSEVLFTPDAAWLLSKGAAEIKLWNMTTARFERRLRGGSNLSVDTSGKLLARVDFRYRLQSPIQYEDGQERHGPVIRVTKLPTDLSVILLDTAGDFAFLTELAFSPSGDELLASGITENGKSSIILAWNAQTWSRTWRIELPGQIYAFAINPDGKSLALARTTQGLDQLDIIDTAKRKIVQSLQGGEPLVRIPIMYNSEVSFSLDGSRIAVRMVPPLAEANKEQPQTEESASPFSERLVVWNLRTGRREYTAEKPWGRFSMDGSLWLTDSRSAVRIDASSGKVLQTLSGSAPSYYGFTTSRDGRWIARGGSNGQVTLWDTRTATEQLNFVGMDYPSSPKAYREYVAFTPEGFYLASTGSNPLVAFRIGQRTYPYQQFDAWYNRPEHVMAKLGRLPDSEISQLAQSRRWRLKKLGIPPDMGTPSIPTTRVQINRRGLSETTKETTLILEVTASDLTTPLARLYVTVNGVPAYPQKDFGLLRNGEHSVAHRMSISLTPGVNRIAAWAVNRRGLSSLVDEFTVRSDAPPQKGRLYVIAVGVSNYASPGHNLTYAAKDARDLAAFARQRFNEWVDEAQPAVIELVDQQATYESILAVRTILAGTKVNDRVVVFFAGHGVLDGQGGYFFGPHDMDFGQPSRYGVSYEAMEELLALAPARRKLLLLDTCHAGELTRGPMRLPFPSRQKLSILPQARSATPLDEQSSMQAILHTVLLDGLFADLRRGSGIAVIAATRGEDFALESSRWQNGAFTRALLAAWEKPGADTDGNFRVTVSELRDFVGDKVLELTGGRQHPVVRRENIEFDFETF
ncbi:caspase family protein [Myxococcus landrumensis]|uniref:Caspase family protein n=1 Tax=Myxococcus landrumensis TaxID=2813577 RepID=A0ABX7NIU8_9BACT|nr:caspase family protein [Myxococcus landrumus]QSQ17467.1 caspase family protein [Myxococcus landrumus]